MVNNENNSAKAEEMKKLAGFVWYALVKQNFRKLASVQNEFKSSNF